MEKDETINNLLDLDGISYVIDEELGLWVKFHAKKVGSTDGRPYGIKYSLTLHDKLNNRIMGFDNSHAIEDAKKASPVPIGMYDHLHWDEKDKGRAYRYQNAEKLITDFWKAVDDKIKSLEER